ncbi:MAG: hypothetical protein FWD84_03945 [Oscillospiraceae bacterium]|nr:hypothetical protein [Oscillospiraceae bacterium]
MTHKAEHLTHLHGDTLVSKDHPRIRLRGKLDSLQAQVVLSQCDLKAADADPALIEGLQEIVETLRELMRAEVLEIPIAREGLFGLTWAEIRTKSYAAPMTVPDMRLGHSYAQLNSLRTAIRETELVAVEAFGAERADLIRVLNRLSSAAHVLMLRS